MGAFRAPLMSSPRRRGSPFQRGLSQRQFSFFVGGGFPLASVPAPPSLSCRTLFRHLHCPAQAGSSAHPFQRASDASPQRPAFSSKTQGNYAVKSKSRKEYCPDFSNSSCFKILNRVGMQMTRPDFMSRSIHACGFPQHTIKFGLILCFIILYPSLNSLSSGVDILYVL